MSEANKVQVGGAHYKKQKTYMATTPDGKQVEVLVPQHWDIVAMHDLDYFQGNITKYVFRWEDKGGVQDLLKSRHYLDKYIELNGGEPTVSIELRTSKELGEAVRAMTPGKVFVLDDHVFDSFYEQIDRFNALYRLPRPPAPTLGALGQTWLARMDQFLKVFREEVAEGEELAATYTAVNLTKEGELAVLTQLADWFGDMVVYIASEARKYGIPLARVVEIIMDSNFSKLGADGKPLYDEATGKVLKGPNYWKPEPKLRELIEASWGTSVEAPNNEELRTLNIPALMQEAMDAVGEVFNEQQGKLSPIEASRADLARQKTDKARAESLGMTVEGWYGNGTQVYKDNESRREVIATSADDARRILDESQ